MTNYKCNKCRKIFNHKNDYRKHLNRKNTCKLLTKESYDFTCRECDKTYSSMSCLNRHIRDFHEQIGKKPKYSQNVLSSCAYNNETVLDNQNSIINRFKDDVKNNYSKNGNFTKNTQHFTQNEKKNIICGFKCNFCGKNFSRKYNLNRHIDDYCKIKKQQDSEKEGIFQQLLDKMNKLEEQNKQLQNEIQNIRSTKNINNGLINNNKNNNNNINSHNTINNNNIEIKLLAFGNEDLSYITDNRYKNIINKGFKSIQEFVTNIHFNKNNPQNHNVYISNMRDNCAMVYDGDKWELRDRTDILDDMYESKRDILEDKFDELLNDLPKHAINKFSRFLNDQQDDKVIKNIKKDIKFILYNNKKIPEETRRLLCQDIFIEEEQRKVLIDC